MLFLTVSTLALTSCSKDDSPNENSKNSIIGKWYLYSIETNGKVETREYEKCGKDYIEFKSDGKMESISYNEKDNCRKEISKGTYSVEGNTLTLKGQLEGKNEVEHNYNFSINDDKMTVNTETDVNGKKVAITLILKKL